MPRGGPRPGSGRKPDPDRKVMISKKLDRTIVAYLKTRDNATAVIEDAITRSKAFREWRKKGD